MSKPKKMQPEGVTQSQENRQRNESSGNEPLSGSKKVKNQNHSRHNNGEG
jgi:small acid-soluble spore protein P (minor)